MSCEHSLTRKMVTCADGQRRCIECNDLAVRSRTIQEFWSVIDSIDHTYEWPATMRQICVSMRKANLAKERR